MADLDRIHADLDALGYAVATDVLDEHDVSATMDELADLAHRERAEGTALLEDGSAADGTYRPGVNQRVVSLLGKGECFRRLVTTRLVVDAARRLFGASYGFAPEVVRDLALDDVLLSSVTANIANLGGRAMALHVDQGFVPPSTPYPVVLNAVWPLVDFTVDNGATRVVPGSHHRDPLVLTTDAADAVPIVAPAGSAILIDGRTWHGTGANHTANPRPAVLANYCPPWVRPFANHSIDLDPTIIATAPPELLDLLGYSQWFVHGHSEHNHLERLQASCRELAPQFPLSRIVNASGHRMVGDVG